MRLVVLRIGDGGDSVRRSGCVASAGRQGRQGYRGGAHRSKSRVMLARDWHVTVMRPLKQEDGVARGSSEAKIEESNCARINSSAFCAGREIALIARSAPRSIVDFRAAWRRRRGQYAGVRAVLLASFLFV